MCFSACDRNFQWVCFIHLCSSDLKIKLTMISASLATVFLTWFCGRLFQVPVKNLNEWEQSLSWEQVLLQKGGRRNAKVPEGEGLEKGRALEIVGLDTDSICFSFPPGPASGRPCGYSVSHSTYPYALDKRGSLHFHLLQSSYWPDSVIIWDWLVTCIPVYVKIQS